MEWVKINRNAIQTVIHVPTVVSVHAYHAKTSEEIIHKWLSVDIVTVGKIVLILAMDNAVLIHMSKLNHTLK